MGEEDGGRDPEVHEGLAVELEDDRGDAVVLRLGFGGDPLRHLDRIMIIMVTVQTNDRHEQDKETTNK